MTAFDDEIGGLVEDIRRYTKNDTRVEFCLVEMMRRIDVEIGALADEARHLDRLVSADEDARIRTMAHNQTVAWQYVDDEDWRRRA